MSREWKFSLCALAALTISLLWPGDALWSGNEQAEILDLALQANSTHRFASYQRGGSTAAIPHPLTIWVYQLLLSVTPDIVIIIFIKQLIVLCAGLVGLWYLAETLKQNKYFILMFFFSLCHYTLSRQIEDSSFLVLFSLLLYVFFAWFYRHKGYAPLVCLGVCVIAVIHHSHRGLIIAAPFGICFLAFEHHWLRKHWLGSMLVFLGVLVICTPYLLTIIHRFYERGVPGAYPLPERSISLAWLFTFVSGGLWYGYDFLQLIPDEYFRMSGVPPVLARAMTGITMTGYLFLVLGMGLTAAGVRRRIRNGETLTLEDRFGVFSLLALLCYMMLLFIFQLFNSWIYHSGLWFCSFYFIWRGVTAAQTWRWVKLIFPVYLAAMMVCWLSILVAVHIYNDRLFTISRAMDIAEGIAAYAPESEIVQLVNWADEGEKFADLIIANSDRGVLSFYYREMGLSMKDACRGLQALQVNLLYNALKPLVYIQRQGRNDFLPARTMVIKKDDGPENRGVILVDDPGQVRAELNRRR